MLLTIWLITWLNQEWEINKICLRFVMEFQKKMPKSIGVIGGVTMVCLEAVHHDKMVVKLEGEKL